MGTTNLFTDITVYAGLSDACRANPLDLDIHVHHFHGSWLGRGSRLATMMAARAMPKRSAKRSVSADRPAGTSGTHSYLLVSLPGAP